MDLKFTDIKCPICIGQMRQGSITNTGKGVLLTKCCDACQYALTIVAPFRGYYCEVFLKKENEEKQ